MRIEILLFAVGVSTVYAAPHHDGTDHTHPPISAPDSESVMSVDLSDTHHSDLYLSKSNSSGPAHVAQTKADATDVHHSDEFMMGTEERDGTDKPVSAAEEVSTTVAPPATKAPTTSAPNRHDPNSRSVVAHGPMAKNDRKHSNDNQSPKTKHSVVHHAPMASEHHFAKFNAHNPPPKSNPTLKSDDKASLVHHAPTATDHSKSSLVAHPSLSKTEPANSGAHAPFAIPKHDNSTSEETATNREEPSTETAEDSTNAPSSETVKLINVHHPTLSKTEGASYVGAHVLVGVPRISSQKKFA
ncbi:Hypothetical protein NTJ_13372 [Nesidiocoris tenuis]|uniref:Uncharacterized protein n=1 Tax=Nesidiocoris tenuis TaxID=355587 RepID=A0ABN7B861_9HEMI|nr:Hypothetical protein NTJ_13372 [Nesidiocoris tenuis]